MVNLVNVQLLNGVTIIAMDDKHTVYLINIEKREVKIYTESDLLKLAEKPKGL